MSITKKEAKNISIKRRTAKKVEITGVDEVPSEEKLETEESINLEDKYNKALIDISTNNDKYIECLNLKSRLYNLDFLNSILLFIHTIMKSLYYS